ncbi:MAG: hypothetical protein K1T65_09470 [Candidatus Aramenus sp.]|nr:hypothetical protein [Candidatus Aramenus sp.]
MKFFKKVKKEKDVNVALEVFSELASSRLAQRLSYPLLTLELKEVNGEKGIEMEYLGERATRGAKNLQKVKEALAFEEWILNVDLKEEHVLAKDGFAYIIDHGHSLTAWKPLYYVQQIIDSSVTRFNLWSDKESFMEGVRNIRGVNYDEVRKVLLDSAKEVLDANFCKLMTSQVAEENVELSLRILKYRARILDRLYN